MNERDNEIEALKDEARHWRRQANRARKQTKEAMDRASQVKSPIVDVRLENEQWWRVYVNGEYIDGQETECVAHKIAERLRRAFEVKP